MTTHPPNRSPNQNKSPGAEIRGVEPSRRRKYTLVTTQAATKSTERVAISRHISAHIQVSVRSSAIGRDARKSSLARTNLLDITARTREKNAMCVRFVASALWEVIIFRSTQKLTDWSREKSWTDLRTQCSFEAKRVGNARHGTLKRRARLRLHVQLRAFSTTVIDQLDSFHWESQEILDRNSGRHVYWV